jgi:ABC-type glycerol-3-phosphate transport system substrate-binding protein
MKTFSFFLLPLVAGLLLAGCGKSNSSASHGANSVSTNQSTNTTPNYNTGNPITAPVDYLGVVGQAKQYSVKQIDLAYLHEAIEQFNAAEGRYPKDLNELIPNYVGKMPQAPFGSKITYDPNTGEVKVVKQ